MLVWLNFNARLDTGISFKKSPEWGEVTARSLAFSLFDLDEVSKLSPNQQSAFSHLLGQNTKNELEIPDDLDRTQHNLQVGKDTLENVKKNVPEFH